MTKKHFIALADYLRGTKPDQSTWDGSGEMIAGRLDQWEADVQAIARFCKSQNGGFMYDRWMDYINSDCGPNGGAVKR